MWKWFQPGIGLKRWLAVLFLGIVMIALGVAYWLAELYRTVAFPPIAYWLTLQFINQWVRGLLFVLIGGGLAWWGWQNLSRNVVRTLVPERADETTSLAQLMYERKQAERGRKVVVIGGGTGLLPVVRALTLVGEPVQVKVILSAAEHGRIVSLLRDQLGLTSRQVIFPVGDHVSLWAELADGRLVEGAMAIERLENGVPIQRLFFSRSLRRIKVWENVEGELSADLLRSYPPDVNPDAVQAIREAEAIVIAPGRLYTDVLPTLTLAEIGAAIRMSEAKRIFVCNIMTEPHKTDGFTVADHLRVIREMAGLEMDYVIVNDAPISPDVLEKYRLEGAEPVRLARERHETVSRLIFADTGEATTLVEGAVVVSGPLITEEPQLIPYRANGEIRMRELAIARHDPRRLAPLLARILQEKL